MNIYFNGNKNDQKKEGVLMHPDNGLKQLTIIFLDFLLKIYIFFIKLAKSDYALLWLSLMLITLLVVRRL